LLFLLSALAWIGSGISAIAGQRHMFGGARGWSGGNVRMRASTRSPFGSNVGGAGLGLLGPGLVDVAGQVSWPYRAGVLSAGAAVARDPCERVTCPGSVGCNALSGPAVKLPTACAPLAAGATCADSVTGRDALGYACKADPGKMHCELNGQPR